MIYIYILLYVSIIYIYIHIYTYIIHSSKHTPSNKKHNFTKTMINLIFKRLINEMNFLGGVSHAILTLKTLSPPSVSYHHLFGLPDPGESSPKLGSISNSCSKRNNFRASHLADPVDSNGVKMGPLNKWPKINGGGFTTVFFFFPYL